MPRSDRLFALLQILRDGNLHRATDMADTLQVSTRTIWRDMATLAASGLPVEGERGVGYILSGGLTLPPVALTRDELEALRYGVQLAGSAADPALARAAVSLRAKIAAVTPDSARDSGADTFVFASAEAARAAPHLGIVRRALREHERLWMRYGRRGERIVRPLQLEFWGRAWTLTAWCEFDNDFRVFRLDIVEAIEPRDRFAPEAGKTVEDYLARVVET
ncbi:MAG: transcriptional regulator [Cereibacter sphaeroides]|uniref:Transcriptional regulator n=1 Tax=Cereibacter sphaeroides TaxID=1063 RepID=A0A2W5S899_CERSP|nr:MAG: transcriptional regulator [Cereibacter sphaeroides]